MFQGQTLQPGTLTEDQMRFTGMARPQGGFGLRGNTAPEMFRDQLTNELVTKAQVDSFGGMQTLLTPSQRSSVAERNRADLFGMQAAQEKAAKGFLGGGDDRFSPMASSADMGLNGRPSVDNTGKFMDNVTGKIVGRPQSDPMVYQGPSPELLPAEMYLRGGIGIQAPPIRPSMGNPSGSLGGQIRPNPYAPKTGGGFGGQMGGGIGGLQQFMQIMQMIMQMVQQFQGGSMGGMGMGMGMGGMGGMRGNNFAQPQRFGGFNQYQSQQQNFNNPYGPY